MQYTFTVLLEADMVRDDCDSSLLDACSICWEAQDTYSFNVALEDSPPAEHRRYLNV